MSGYSEYTSCTTRMTKLVTRMTKLMTRMTKLIDVNTSRHMMLTEDLVIIIEPIYVHWPLAHDLWAGPNFNYLSIYIMAHDLLRKT